jgi:type I restriction enzyme S subunit
MSLMPAPPFTEYDSLPAEWRMATLADVATLSRRIFQPNNDDILLPYVGLEHISPGNPRLSNWGSSVDVQSSKNWFVAGQVLYGKLRPYLDKAVIAEFEGVCSTDILVIDATDVATAAFLVYLLHTPNFVAHAIATTGGVNLPRTNWASLTDFVFPLPPLPEQRRIAAVLNAIQDAIASQEDVIAAARAFKRSLMQRLFIYGPGWEPAPTKETEISEIPAHWEVVPIADICTLMQYGTSQRCDTRPEGVPVLRIPNVDNGAVDLTDLKYAEFSQRDTEHLQLHRGDLLFVRTNGRRENAGRCAVYEGSPERALFASYLIRVRFPHESVAPQFVQAFASMQAGARQLSGRAIETADGKFNINTETIRTTVVPLPGIDEQETVVAQIRAADAKIAAEEDRKTALAALFKSMLHQLMTGQMRLLTDEGLPIAPDLPSLSD